MVNRRVLAVATGNVHKVEEIGAVLDSVGIDVITAAHAGAPPDFDPEETGLTFEDNSLIKAKALADILFGGDMKTVLGEADIAVSRAVACGADTEIIGVVADDSGLCVDALGGAPGVFSARYAGSGMDADNTAKLLAEIEDVRGEKRTARFVCVITYMSCNGEVTVCRGECAGRIIREPRGNGGFGYDPVFVPDAFSDAGMTFAEMSASEKNKISHRAVALAKLRETLSV